MNQQSIDYVIPDHPTQILDLRAFRTADIGSGHRLVIQQKLKHWLNSKNDQSQYQSQNSTLSHSRMSPPNFYLRELLSERLLRSINQHICASQLVLYIVLFEIVKNTIIYLSTNRIVVLSSFEPDHMGYNIVYFIPFKAKPNRQATIRMSIE